MFKKIFHTWCLFLYEEGALLTNGYESFYGEKIKENLKILHGNLTVFLQMDKFQTMEVLLPYEVSWWQRFFELPKLLGFEARNYFGAQDGVGYVALSRPYLYSTSLSDETDKNKFLLGYVPQDRWLRRWLSLLETSTLTLRKITPLASVMGSYIQTMVYDLRTANHQYDADDLNLIFAPFEPCNATLLFVLWKGDLVLSRSWKGLVNTAEQGEYFFNETILHFDGYPKTRPLKKVCWVFDGKLKRVEETESGLKVASTRYLSFSSCGNEKGREKEFFQWCGEGKVLCLPTMNISFSYLASKKWMDRVFIFLKIFGWVFIFFAALTVVLWGEEIFSAWQDRNRIYQDVQKLKEKKNAFPPLSKNRETFIKAVQKLEKQYDQAEKSLKTARPLVMLPKLATAFGNTWRAQDLKWQRFHGQQTLSLAVRYSGSDSGNEKIVQDFDTLYRVLGGSFKGDVIAVEEAPFEGSVTETTSMRNLKDLQSRDIPRGRIVITKKDAG